ncbi:transposase, partial [Nonomuraea sp. NPDC055795]
VAALEPGRSSWTALLDVVRLGPADDATAVTAAQLRAVVERLIAAGQWSSGDPDILIVTDAGYDITRLAYALRDLPVELLGRIRSDRVLLRPAPSREEFMRANPYGGRPPKYGGQFALSDPITWHEADVATVADTSHYGKAEASAWDRLHPRLTHRAAWLDHDGALPIIEGTLIRLKVEYLPGDRDAPPVWLWSSKTGATGADVDRCWQAFLRRFDLEHTFRFWKQTLGWTRPKLRAAQAADRWTWLLIAVCTQLRLGRHLAADLRHPWEKPASTGQLTPARVRRGFRNLRPTLAQPARAPKPSKRGPGRPPGIPNRRPATRYDVGKTVKRGRTLADLQQPGG